MESRNVDVDEKKPNIMGEIGPEKKEKKKKIIIRYRECMKNHAASIGGNARDGCGEFMASSGDDSLNCSACKCHRNFHRKLFESEDSDHDTPSSSPSPYYDFHHHLPSKMVLSNYNIDVAAGDHHHEVMKPLLTHDLCLTRYNSNNNKSGGSNGSSDDHDECDERKRVKMMKKRFRTKFSEEQKEKMLGFAEKVGWRMQKLDQSMVQQFCEEAGISRRVLKVWMHNNKNSFAKRNHLISTS